MEPLVFFRITSSTRKSDEKYVKLRLQTRRESFNKTLNVNSSGNLSSSSVYCAMLFDIPILKSFLPDDVDLEMVEESDVRDRFGLRIFRADMDLPAPPENLKSLSIMVVNPYLANSKLMLKLDKELRLFRNNLARKGVSVHFKSGCSVNSRNFQTYGDSHFCIFEKQFLPLSVQDLMRSNLIISLDGSDSGRNAFLPGLQKL